MNDKIRSGMASSAKRLLDGQKRLSDLRSRFGGSLHFAVDNNVVMGFVSPLSKHADIVRGLLHDQNGFSVKDQELSLAERVSGYVLFDAAKTGNGRVFALPGHHTELWASLAGGIHSRLTTELNAHGEAGPIAAQMMRFRNDFYNVAVAGSKIPTVEQLIAAVPDQMRGWLGIGTAAVEWDRLKYLKVKDVLRPFPKEVIDRAYLSEGEKRQFFSLLTECRDKWERHLKIAQYAWIKAGGMATDQSLVSLRVDAVALAFWERLNLDYYTQPHERLVLVTSSERIFLAVRAADEENEPGDAAKVKASDYLLHPFDFLDECHLHLSGELRPSLDSDSSGRLSSALEMLVTADSPTTVKHAEQEFGEVWGKFLRASVLERVQKINRAHSTHLRRVAFVFSRVGMAEERAAGNPLVLKLAETGSEMLSEAADIRIGSLAPDVFTRGAPMLRLDKHPWAQEIQLKSPQEFCRLVTNNRERTRLLAEAGDHRYTLHLLQARAMIWAGDWRTALRLSKFALAIRDKLPKPNSQNVPDIDGREAEFLAAVCERHAHGDSFESLFSALDRATRHLNAFVELASNAHLGGAISDLDVQVHQLRAHSESLAIETTRYLLGMLRSTEDGRDESSQKGVSELSIAVFLSGMSQLRQSAQEIINKTGKDVDGNFLQYISARILQQAWCNELQIRLCAPGGFGIAKTAELERLWTEQSQAQARIDQLHHVKIPRSWFIDTLTYVLGIVLGRDVGLSRDAVLNRLTDADIKHPVFPYDRQRNSRLRLVIEGKE
ncbi:MAG: hypothetical protein V5B60_09980 [Accumulibacter sp.]|jgi:hypothetical protein|uniref:hypothetical protein n=1 Tax=Accumulibacter sp. TaxID=2053492 RepID=UPI002FC2AA93